MPRSGSMSARKTTDIIPAPNAVGAKIGSKRLGAEGGRRDDACAPDAAMLQQPGPPVARHQVVGLAGQRQGQQEGIVRVVSLDAVRQRRQRLQHTGALQVVDHRADAVGGQNGLDLGVAAHPSQFIELHRSCHQLKTCLHPGTINGVCWTVRRDQCCQQLMGVEDNPHQCSRAHCTASSMRSFSSASPMPAVAALACSTARSKR